MWSDCSKKSSNKDSWYQHYSRLLGITYSVVFIVSSAAGVIVPKSAQNIWTQTLSMREPYEKLVDNFSHESDVTSPQDLFTSRPYKPLFYFNYCVHVKSQEAYSSKWCERCLVITESPKTPGHYRYLIWVLCYIPYMGLAVPNPCRIFAIFSTLSLCSCGLRHCVEDYVSLVLSCVSFGELSTSDDDLGSMLILPYGTFSSADASNLLIPINGLLHVGLKPSIYGRAARL